MCDHEVQTCLLVLVDILTMIAGFGLPIAMIVLGHNHVNSCPYSSYIPVYLQAVGGCDLILLVAFISFYHCGDERTPRPRACKVVFGIIFVVCVGLQISGDVVVYSAWKSQKFSSSPESDAYCQGNFFDFAFWATIFIQVLYVMFPIVYAVNVHCINVEVRNEERQEHVQRT